MTRKARQTDLHFTEKAMPLKLSERDAILFLKAMADPPNPNAAARKAARRFSAKYG